MLQETLTRIARRVSDCDYDARHAILDVAADLLALRDSIDAVPVHLRAELEDLLTAIEQVQPAYPSRRTTSPLFDRAGMGQAGRDRAIRLVQRLKAVTAAIQAPDGT